MGFGCAQTSFCPHSPRSSVQIRAPAKGGGVCKCVHTAYEPYSVYIYIYTHKVDTNIYNKSSRTHRNTGGSISSHRSKPPHTYLPGCGGACLSGGPRAFCTYTHTLDLPCSAPRRSQKRRIRPRPRRPSPGPQAAGSPRFLRPHGRTPLPFCYLRRMSLALEVSPIGYSPGEVEGQEGGGGRGAGLQWGRGVSSKK